jgi:hypothetical protein
MTWALVTGATAGLGAEFARQIAAGGQGVVLVARDTARLKAFAAEIRSSGVEAEVLAADLGTRGGVDRVAARLSDDARPVELLVNNAGFGLRRGFLSSSAKELDEALDVMVRAVMHLSQAAAKAMVARGEGRIVNVASVAAATASGPYSAHKAWVQTFTESLAITLHGTGVTATVVRPGLVRTEFHERAGLDYGGLPSAVWLEAPRVVRATLRASRRGRVIVTPSARYATMMGLMRVLPRRLIRRTERGARR